MSLEAESTTLSPMDHILSLYALYFFYTAFRNHIHMLIHELSGNLLKNYCEKKYSNYVLVCLNISVVVEV